MPQKTDNPDSFLSRWSKRKLTEAEVETSLAEVGDDGQIGHNSRIAETEAEPELSDPELLEKLGLPDPDQMVAGDDFKAFMKSGIPQRFRNKALRRLWISNPVLANLDEMVDYGEDFTDAATVIENMQTVYEVGVGAARRVREELDAAKELAEQLAAEQAASVSEEVEVAEEPTEPEPAEMARNTTQAEEAPTEIAMAFANSDATSQEHLTLRKARPMRFDFD